MDADSSYTFVIADPQPLDRYGLGRLIESQSQFHVLAEVPAGADAIAAVHRHHPQCLLMSFDFPDTTGLQVLRELSALATRPRCIMLAAAPEPNAAVQALHLGACGVLNKNWPTAIMLRAIHKVVFSGEICLEREYISELVRANHNNHQYRLTPRELQIVSLIVDGRSRPPRSLQASVFPLSVGPPPASFVSLPIPRWRKSFFSRNFHASNVHIRQLS